MSHMAQSFLQNSPPNYNMLKEELEVATLGASRSPEPVASTVINIQPEVSVPDHVVWSLFNTIFMNFCCLGFAAFTYSVKSRDRKMVGDMVGARSYASTARCLNISALILGLLYNIGIIAAVIFAIIICYEMYYRSLKGDIGF